MPPAFLCMKTGPPDRTKPSSTGQAVDSAMAEKRVHQGTPPTMRVGMDLTRRWGRRDRSRKPCRTSLSAASVNVFRRQQLVGSQPLSWPFRSSVPVLVVFRGTRLLNCAGLEPSPGVHHVAPWTRTHPPNSRLLRNSGRRGRQPCSRGSCFAPKPTPRSPTRRYWVWFGW
jgi:hypothetical protein